MKEVMGILRETLLCDKVTTDRDPQIIFVSDWHPMLKKLPNILRKHHHILRNDPKLCRVFPSAPFVAFRRSKSVRNYVVHNDIGIRAGPKVSRCTKPCGSCKLCDNIAKSSSEIQASDGRKLQIISGGTCKSSNVIYAACCKKRLPNLCRTQ